MFDRARRNGAALAPYPEVRSNIGKIGDAGDKRLRQSGSILCSVCQREISRKGIAAHLENFHPRQDKDSPKKTITRDIKGLRSAEGGVISETDYREHDKAEKKRARLRRMLREALKIKERKPHLLFTGKFEGNRHRH